MSKMRSFVVLAVLLASLAGCAATKLLSGGPAVPEKSVCIARYEQVVPGIDVGRDGCGNRWLRQAGRCLYFISDQGVVVEITCPAEGDTTYAGE